MINDEIKQALDGILRASRDAWQIKDGHVSIDTPAHHILVKDASQFGRMLVRRGYQMEEGEDEYGSVYKVKIGSGEHIAEYSFRADAFLYKTVVQVAEEIDEYFIQHRLTGRRHVQCSNCGMPLLFYGKYLYEEGNCLKWYMCQRVGTISSHEDQLEACPGCGIAFDSRFSIENPPPIRRIDDVSEDEEDRKWDETIASPKGQAAMSKLAEEVRQQIEAGEYEEGGFGYEDVDSDDTI